MRDDRKTMTQVIGELGDLRRRVVEPEKSEAQGQQAREASPGAEEKCRRFVEENLVPFAISNLKGD